MMMPKNKRKPVAKAGAMTQEELAGAVAVAKFEADCNVILKRKYCSTWADLCGDKEPLIRAIEDGETPAEFVAWWADKYDLIDVSEISGGWK